MLHNIANNIGTSDVTQIESEIEQHYSKLTSIIQAQKQEITDKIISLKNAEKESLYYAKNKLADSIAKAKSVIAAINKSLSVDKIKQVYLCLYF